MPGVIGVAGCGAMGLPMARHLDKAGFDVRGFDVRPLSDFADFQHRMVERSRDFGRGVDTLISVVRDWRQTEDLCFDDQALFRQATYPKTLIVSSTLSPRVLGHLQDRLPGDVTLIDAPMSGAPFRAESASLTFMVGGAETIVKALMPVFKAMGDVVHHLGPVSAGMTCKVVNNFVAASSVVAVRRALASAAALGVDQATMLDIMHTSSGGTWFGDHFDTIDWAGEGYAPSNTMGILEKDMMAYIDALDGLPGIGRRDFERAIIDGLRAMEELST